MVFSFPTEADRSRSPSWEFLRDVTDGTAWPRGQMDIKRACSPSQAITARGTSRSQMVDERRYHRAGTERCWVCNERLLSHASRYLCFAEKRTHTSTGPPYVACGCCPRQRQRQCRICTDWPWAPHGTTFFRDRLIVGPRRRKKTLMHVHPRQRAAHPVTAAARRL